MKPQVVITRGYAKGHWTVAAPARPDMRKTKRRDRAQWVCTCRCGKIAVHSESSLVHNMTAKSACASCAALMTRDRNRNVSA